MKKRYSLSLVLILFCTYQLSAQNTCSTPYLFATGSTYSYVMDTGVVYSDTTNDYGCLQSTPNPLWLYLDVCISGPITLNMQCVGSSGSGMDADFVVWGPLSSSSFCGMDSTQIVDCSFSTSTQETIIIPNALTGQYYKVLITNFSNQPGTVNISQTSGTGAACDTTTIACSVVPVFQQQICKVTTDHSVNHNIVFWDKDPQFFGFYNIQRETTTMGVYSTIASVPSTDTSVYEDVLANPMIQSHKYRIETADTCGHSMVAPAHQTIHLLTSSNLATGYPQLSWNPYQGFSYGTYFIYRGATPSSIVLYDSISASNTTYTDVNPASGINYYAVSVIPPVPCQPSRSFNDYSISNLSPVLFTGITDLDLSQIVISPNPAQETLTISFGEKQIENGIIELFDLTGRLVLTESIKNENVKRLELNSIENGCYLFSLKSENDMIQKKIIVNK
ncbi:MAG: T9SS type A sorting domain-containing protein [Bacteroidetes bacterium]|nr:T9SS type A sorting domain-containing protein [Bacteroidota bacterium]